MNHTVGEAEAYAVALRQFLKETPIPMQLFIVPPFTALKRVCELLEDSPVLVGAQNMHWEDNGALTGEISPLMVKECGAQLVELGHSERRAEFGETDWTVNRKVLSALRHGLRPLVCVGETARDREFGAQAETVVRQVRIALHEVTADRMKEVILAYEPVWAIGEAGTPALPGDANTMQGVIRKAVASLFGDSVARNLPILYGGSVSANNAAALLAEPEVNGLFIGRAAWDVEGFIEIIRLANRMAGSPQNKQSLEMPGPTVPF